MKNFTPEKYWYVKHLNIFNVLSDADAYALEQIVTYKALTHEERICAEGVYLIKEGRIKITEEKPDVKPKTDENREVKTESGENLATKEVLEEGEIFGAVSVEDDLEADSDTHSYAECLTEVCLGIVRVRDFSFFLKRKPHLAMPFNRKSLYERINLAKLKYGNKVRELQFGSHNMLRTATILGCEQTNAFNNITFRSASSRYALLLLNLSLTPDKSGSVFVPRLSTKRISRLIGTSTETIDILFGIFKQHSVLDKRRGRIQILNSWQLKKIADARMQTLTEKKVVESITENDVDFESLFNNVQVESKSGSVPT